MAQTADVIVVGAGVQGASLAFHLARRGVGVLILERSTVAAAPPGRSSGFVRMHYDLESEARLAWASHRYFRDWADMVGDGDCGFVRTGFVQLVPEVRWPTRCAPTSRCSRGVGIPTTTIDADDVAALMPGIRVDDVAVAAPRARVRLRRSDRDRRPGSSRPPGGSARATSAGASSASVVDRRRSGHRRRYRQGAVRSAHRRRRRRVPGRPRWPRPSASSCPVEPWRHATAYFGLPAGRAADFPVVIDNAAGIYFRPEGRELMLVGLETDNIVGGSPDRPRGAAPANRPSMRWSTGSAHASHGWSRAPTGPRTAARTASRPTSTRSSTASARRLLPRVRVLGHRVQDRARDRRVHGGADPRRAGDDRRHLALRARSVRRGPPPRGRASYGHLWR